MGATTDPHIAGPEEEIRQQDMLVVQLRDKTTDGWAPVLDLLQQMTE